MFSSVRLAQPQMSSRQNSNIDQHNQMASNTFNAQCADPGAIAQPIVNNGTADTTISPASRVEQTSGVTAFVVDIATPVQHGYTESRPGQDICDVDAVCAGGLSQARSQLDDIRQSLDLSDQNLEILTQAATDGVDEAYHAAANEEKEACPADGLDVEVLKLKEGPLHHYPRGKKPGKVQTWLPNDLIHDQVNGVNGNLMGPNGGSEHEVNGGSINLGHSVSDNGTRGLTDPGLGPGPSGDSEHDANGGLTALGYSGGINETNGNSACPTHGEEADSVVLNQVEEIGDAPPDRTMRKRVRIMFGITVAIILITASALKAAGYTYHDIQWPITVEIMIATLLLSPTLVAIV
ncbi:hypothetical protein F4860DRAFT_479030 [Xylaria cubensis]|nr:hypothetical protein F4860DRAFT_479030 [Xylaria cubensis]